VLVSLSKKAADADLKIPAKFAAIVGDQAKYPVLSGLEDNVQFEFNAAYNPYPKNPTSLGRDGTRENVGAAFVNLTASLHDPRTYIAATPAPLHVESNIVEIKSGGSTTATLMTQPAHPFKVGETITISKAKIDGYNKTAVVLSVPSDSTLTYAVSAGLADIPLKTDSDDKEVVVGAAGKNFADFTAYVGAPAGLSMSDLGTYAQSGSYSYVNALRYSFDFAGSKAEPAIIIGYPELCFNIAEAINRGWVTGQDAGDWYEAGIRASMEFLGISSNSIIPVGNLNGTKTYGSIKNISIDDYLTQPEVAYQDGADGLKQILTQKYIAFWQNSNWEAFFNQRRTGVPAFSTGPGTGNGSKIPMRWQYPVAESASNAANYNSAISRQYSGADDLNGVMWILQ